MERGREDRDPTAPEADVDEQQRAWDDDEQTPAVPDVEPGVPEADAWEQAQDAALDDDFDRR
ncbi:MAG TPA: hypothetical protein VHJ34_13915 [Actinomycetota bacterium]|nr:hypothetical protein [Actinomycetota bacterium]